MKLIHYSVLILSGNNRCYTSIVKKMRNKKSFILKSSKEIVCAYSLTISYNDLK